MIESCKRIIRVFSLSTLTLLAVIVAPTATAELPNDLRLVVQITVDMLRGDVPWRYRDRFGERGFRYLMEKGTVFNNAHYQHSTTFTAVGHGTLVTGGNAAQHGLAGNDWYDVETGKQVYCVEDDRHPIIGKETKAHSGTSPRNLTASTTGDELVLATAGRSRVFSVSIKDRGAILPGGHLGKAFWYSSGTGEFVTSTYYYSEYPAWVTAWNEAKHADRYQTASWELLHDKASYVYSGQDDRLGEKSYKKLGSTFPHPLGNERASDFYKGLRFAPMGDELTLDFVKELVQQEKVGQGDAVDMLMVSFSATDYIGHAFGTHSLEYEDNLLRMDALLEDFFDFLDEKVGLDKILMVLSSDHGSDDIPEYQATLHLANPGRHYPKKFVEYTNQALQERYDSEENFVVAFWNPSLYLNLATVEKLQLDVAEVERSLVEAILEVPGFAMAFRRTDLLAGDITHTKTTLKLQNAFHPRRSGNVLIIQDPFWYLYPNADQFAAMHGSPYAYDTYVPIMVAGPRVPAQLVSRSVAPRDIASTITTYLGIRLPSGSIGEPLHEVLIGQR